MAEAEESPAQRQARIRREKREAKIRATGSQRLDKITRLSGRIPETMRNESPNPPNGQSPLQPQGLQSNETNSPYPAQMQAQEESLRTLLRVPPPDPQQQQQQPEDPMMKLLNQMMTGSGDGSTTEPNGVPFSPEDLSKATGLPPFLWDNLLGKKDKGPQTEAELQTSKMWRIIRTLFTLIISVYAVFIIQRSVRLFGKEPPAPATIRNPFLIFTTGELVIQGSKRAFSGPASKRGLALAFQVLKDLVADGLVVIFIIGAWSWWRGSF